MSRAVHRIFYDDECAFCVRQMRRVRALDWLGRFRLVPRSTAEAQAAGLSPDALAAAIHCVTAEGRVLRGAAGLRFVGLRLPLVAPLAALLWLPGALGLAERAYAWFSRRRYQWGSLPCPAARCGSEGPLPPAPCGGAR